MGTVGIVAVIAGLFVIYWTYAKGVGAPAAKGTTPPGNQEGDTQNIAGVLWIFRNGSWSHQ